MPFLSSSSSPPSPTLITFHLFLSFIVCNIDRINLSLAIIPLSQQYNFSSTTQGQIQSSFFLGYTTTQILGGHLADLHSGFPILALGVTLWSLCTVLTPPAAAVSLPVLLLARILLGMGEGVAMPAMNAIVARYVPEGARSRALSFIYSGMYVGSILGLLLSPPIMAWWGWGAVFYVFGGVGVIWVAVFWVMTRFAVPVERIEGNVSGRDDKGLVEGPKRAAKVGKRIGSAGANIDNERLLQMREGALERSIGPDDAVGEIQRGGEETSGLRADLVGAEAELWNVKPTVWEMLQKRCVMAIIVAHFCSTWGYFVLLTWLPTYLYSKFELKLSESALLSAIPWVAMFISSNISGSIADGLIANGMDVTKARKLMQTIGFVGPASFLALLRWAGNAYIAMLFVSSALALSAFSVSGVYATHQDIGPNVAGTLLGISNTFASVPGIVGVFITGVVLDATDNNWNVVFAIAIAFYVLGLVVYLAFATSKRQW